MAYEISSGDMKSESGENHRIDYAKTRRHVSRAPDPTVPPTGPDPDRMPPPRRTRHAKRAVTARHTRCTSITRTRTHTATQAQVRHHVLRAHPLHLARNSRTQPTRLKPPLRSCSRASLLLLDPNAHRQLLRALDSEIRFASAKHPPGRSFLVSCPRVSELQRVLRVRVREVSR